MDTIAILPDRAAVGAAGATACMGATYFALAETGAALRTRASTFRSIENVVVVTDKNINAAKPPTTRLVLEVLGSEDASADRLAGEVVSDEGDSVPSEVCTEATSLAVL